MKISALTTSQIITSRFYLIDISHIDKICDLVCKIKNEFLCKRIGCEAQEGVE